MRSKERKPFSKRPGQFYLILLSLLGFAPSCQNGCNRIIDDSGTKYGVPQADYVFRGDVTDAINNKGIKGIQVTMRTSVDSTTQMNDVDSLGIITDANGKYNVNVSGAAFKEKYVMSFRDVDGKENGSYQAFDTVVSFLDVPFEKGNTEDEWYSGVKTLNVDAKLKPEP